MTVRQEIIDKEDAVLVGQDSGLVVHASYSHVQNDRELVAQVEVNRKVNTLGLFG